MYCLIECIESSTYVFDIICTKWIIDEDNKLFKWPGSLSHTTALKQQKDCTNKWKSCNYSRILVRDIGKQKFKLNF